MVRRAKIERIEHRHVADEREIHNVGERYVKEVNEGRV